MKQVQLVLVGGFLGAGKTTLLAQAATHLVAQGKRVGLITNDQATDLVDSGLLRQEGLQVGEVAGGCFCCRFNDLVAAADKLMTELKPDILMGEPVGSCTDLAATVIRPMQALHGDWFKVAPFTVLTDPGRLREALAEGGSASFPDNVLYIYRKQLEEADLIVVNKLDQITPAAAAELQQAVASKYPGTRVLAISAQTGTGVDQWLDAVLSGSNAGRRQIPVNYDTYADGEAVLGWLNAGVTLEAGLPTDWAAFVRGYLALLHADLKARSAEIAHLKLLLTTPSGSLVANLTSTAGTPSFRGDTGPLASNASLTVNARVHMSPDDLRAAVEAALAKAAASAQCRVNVLQIQSFRPGRPQPTHHMGGTTEAL
ncbi:MAG: hypothetical protein A3K19_14410 [Lentisphaerae bacterium RIFOXYB12_FULL_65_16]|nr:MAG: hypothetical protein A3K18_18455 [Lentisphaerae bacterium RIFOXYA12_64_32]OGV87416.1 MAG: hypothetical protein A3K19_14410 [Lentisphaerae bacterium RIFOXYB12_FULL_65_16]